ncbi:SDR family NAD(P)-dependent oxidoreductase [Paraperlucidibaca wandonensis]|jgi:short-subunit dehydrogenase|uniref:SDR family NAD(P)-dependent oxidoreductase n=1 Tax=Paraperlucidibaca wandonensis TaxID=1268273 RepID=A0ABW3HFZ1_9GAMM|nr:SDR family NAD(P)-dependent oxidoreductase [Paraperlucidibaca sp.]MBQ0723680.1 SDR family NAD(P)-dependent oxidoreductase [Paraperlucidibaca sp.]MBQ0842501.1 SDR family NAD(P)-dependent oxidoreductase [Paraperlucidibaca sp.]
MKDFKNKVAAITGAGSGMGRSLAVLLAARGCHVALSDINEKGLAETVKLLDGTGVKVTSQKLDVADKDAVFAWADKVAGDHGKVNLIFNNAGVALGSVVDGGGYDDFEWIMNINFWGVVHGTKAFLPYLKDAGDGHIINTSSLFGLIAVPSQSAYNASKFAVRGFTEALREELDLQKVGVSATSVHPGGIKTNIAKAARMDQSISKIGMDASSTAKFEKLFRTTADEAAAQMLRAVEKNQRRLLIGADAKVLDLVVRIFPSGYQKLIAMGSSRMK